MQIKEEYSSLYNLKQKATQHITNKKYSWATVYLIDALKQFDQKIQNIEDADQMEKLIRDIKLPCHKNLSLCYMKQSNPLGCIEQCKQVLEIQPNCVKVLYRMGTSYLNMKQRNLVQAQKYLKRAFLLDPNQKEVMKALQQIQYKKKQDRENGKTQQKPCTITAATILKYMFLWPIFLLIYLYNRFVPQKFKYI